ncbi:hypothetical protein [Actinokineospora sp. NBRC 105648]|uniref:hypothetical protein n=1 Tax=Actinokineospora sp. NBRC 105648 TaxID=3032206 RepID=UPI002555FC8B|nr:hypothetical protein [Actinokineospora sp. NBRC 105648]
MNVTISFDPDVDDLDAVLTAVSGTFDVPAPEDSAVELDDEVTPPIVAEGDWTAARVRRYLPNLAAEARSLVSLVACAKSGTLTAPTLGAFIGRGPEQIRV